MALRLETGCSRYYPHCTHNDRNTLSLGGDFIERGGLQRIRAYYTFYARHHIPRDASQQAYVGEHIDIASDFSNLQPGDLIFFGRKATAERKERVVHVGMYIGGKRFIHSQGDVHISSFDPLDELFDEYNLGRLLFAARVLPYINKKEGLNTTATNEYYE